MAHPPAMARACIINASSLSVRITACACIHCLHVADAHDRRCRTIRMNICKQSPSYGIPCAHSIPFIKPCISVELWSHHLLSTLDFFLWNVTPHYFVPNLLFLSSLPCFLHPVLYIIFSNLVLSSNDYSFQTDLFYRISYHWSYSPFHVSILASLLKRTVYI